MKRIKGTNQYKDKYRAHWKKWLIAYAIFIVFIAGLIRIQEKFTERIDKTFTQESTKIISPLPKNPEKLIIIKEDKRISKLRLFLNQKSSPLADYAKEIVEASDAQGVDWTLITAIAGKESSFGKQIKEDSYNAWGLMAWNKTGKRFIRSFSSWKEGISFEAKLLSENYRLNANRAIGIKYCPKEECSDTWAEDVSSFSTQVLQ